MPQYMLLVYTDAQLLEALPPGQFDTMMRDCFTHVDELQRDGRLLQSQMLDEPKQAKAVRIRQGRMTATDGPFAEAKEMLGGFNLIEARDMDEAVQIASELPWAQTGCIEVRAVRSINAVRERVGSAKLPA